MIRDDTLRAQPDMKLEFLRGFLRHPRGVGSVVPSSRFLERRLVEFANVAQWTSVVELGPGTGGTTRAILRAMRRDATLLAIELDALFAEAVGEIGDRRLFVHKGSAEFIGEALATHGLCRPHLVISGIQFSTMPADIGTRIIESVRRVLAPGGLFVAYQLRSTVAELAAPIMGEPRRQ